LERFFKTIYCCANEVKIVALFNSFRSPDNGVVSTQSGEDKETAGVLERGAEMTKMLES